MRPAPTTLCATVSTLLLSVPLSPAATYVPAKITPPAPQREFRAAWVATVGNNDWP
jgi:hypothetical protein